ncbi:hypothetical protein [Flavisolibacter tropicus]|uniref:Uncharacterized protein n=1 Tax=Flavisolibacter tropicus TaxID=1492898 RepID=A0A172TV81_9BACT|nr:hypothetical protein [Flavisolibacter tropicus]ANE50647.1 hypothetical protein SY85_09165 [Flavisolibacter tropicus]
MVKIFFHYSNVLLLNRALVSVLDLVMTDYAMIYDGDIQGFESVLLRYIDYDDSSDAIDRAIQHGIALSVIEEMVQQTRLIASKVGTISSGYIELTVAEVECLHNVVHMYIAEFLDSLISILPDEGEDFNIYEYIPFLKQANSNGVWDGFIKSNMDSDFINQEYKAAEDLYSFLQSYYKRNNLLQSIANYNNRIEELLKIIKEYNRQNGIE